MLHTIPGQCALSMLGASLEATTIRSNVKNISNVETAFTSGVTVIFTIV